ncbi:MAG: hypothetical protein ACREGG_04400 [Candidatus Saccharimonadales bacterium]
MSTSQEVREELPPSPIEIIDNFDKAHEELINAGQAVLDLPSYKALADLEEKRTALRRASSPLVLSDFFKESNNVMTIDAGVGAFVLSGDALFGSAKELSPPGSQLALFLDELRDELTQAIHSSDFSYFTEDIQGELPEDASDQQIADHILVTLGNFYLLLIDQYCGAISSTNVVREFVEAEEQEIEMLASRFQARAEKIQQAKLLGAVIAAAFAGTYLANKLQKRR